MTKMKYIAFTLVLILCSLASIEAQTLTVAVPDGGNRAVSAAAPQVPVNLSGSSDKAIVTVTNTGAPTGGGVGVSGNAPVGYGVQGSGLIGVQGMGGANGTGVSGSSSGTGTGVLGQSIGIGGKGVHGVGRSYGVYGESPGAAGVYGLGTTNLTSGVTGVNLSGGLAGYFGGPVQISGKLEVVGGCLGCSPPSDRNLKANFFQVNPRFILNRLASIPIQSWNYKSEADGIRHIGPMAQDFRTAFGLGESDKTLNTVDAQGVALAAIQGLYQMIQEKDKKIEEQNSKIQQLEQRMLQLERSATRRGRGKAHR